MDESSLRQARAERNGAVCVLRLVLPKGRALAAQRRAGGCHVELWNAHCQPGNRFGVHRIRGLGLRSRHVFADVVLGPGCGSAPAHMPAGGGSTVNRRSDVRAKTCTAELAQQ